MPPKTSPFPAHQVAPVVFDRAAVQKALHAFAPKMRLYELDGRYRVLTRAEWDFVVKEVGPEHNRYLADFFDCDAFSRAWYGRIAEDYEINGMFIVVDFGAKHSYNLMLEHDGKGNLSCCLFEPPTLQRPAKGTGHYTMNRGFLL